MRRFAYDRWLIGLAMVAIAGCQEKLPTAPSELTTGIVIYEHIDFQGASAHVDKDLSDLSDFKGPCTENQDDFVTGTSSNVDVWNDCISSVRVAPGWRATLYRGKGYGDDALDITADVSDLRTARHDCPKGGLNDCVSSIRVRRALPFD